jgi:predicted acetyltransferase
VIIRCLQAQDMPQAREIWEEAFTDKPAFVDWYFHRRFQPEEGIGIFSGSRLLCNLHLMPYQLRLRGRVFPSAYLIGLATREEYRRQGLAKELLTFTLRSLRERGVFFTFLMPFAIPFYTHLGWGICGQHRIYRLPPGAVFPEEETPASPGKPVGTGGEAVVEAAVTAVTGEEILQEPPVTGRETIPPKPAVIEREPAPDPAVLDRIYRHWSFSLNGCLLRKGEDWEGLLFDHFLDGGEVWFLKETGAGPTAYALIYPGTETFLREMAYLAPAAGRRLLQHLVATTGKPLVWTAPDQALPFSLPGPEEIKPVFLGRITHLQAALEFPLYPPGPPDAWRLRVEDPLLPENNGVFILAREGNGKIRVTPARDTEADLACTTGGLARLLSGTISPEEARKNRLLTGGDRQVSSFLRLFPKGGLYINDYF